MLEQKDIDKLKGLLPDSVIGQILETAKKV